MTLTSTDVQILIEEALLENLVAVADGDLMCREIKVTNNNDTHTATTVVATIVLPVGVTFVSATPSGTGTYIPGTHTWNIGSLAPETSATLDLCVTIDDGCELPTTVAASITFDQCDPNADNNTLNKLFGGVPCCEFLKCASDLSYYIGEYDADTNTPDLDTAPSGGIAGHTYTVSVAGNFFTTAVDVGDVLIANIDTPTLEAHWTVVQGKLTPAVIKTKYESNADTNAYTDAELAKVGFITVTQAVDLDTMESDIATNNAKVGVTTEISNIVEDVTPQLGAQLDVNGFGFGDGTLELLSFVETASAVNEITITNAATGTAPSITATGDDADIDLVIDGKGTGDVKTLSSNLDVTGSITASTILVTSGQEDVADAAAISLVTDTSYFTTGGAETATLPDGVEGQRKTLLAIDVSLGDMVVTPANFGNGTTLTFDTSGGVADLKFMQGAWYLTGAPNNVTIA